MGIKVTTLYWEKSDRIDGLRCSTAMQVHSTESGTQQNEISKEGEYRNRVSALAHRSMFAFVPFPANQITSERQEQGGSNCLQCKVSLRF
jgi:hypothetical protein